MTVFPFLLTITPFLRKSALMTPKYISLQLSSCEGHINDSGIIGNDAPCCLCRYSKDAISSPLINEKYKKICIYV